MRAILRVVVSLFILTLLVDIASVSHAYAYKCPPDCKPRTQSDTRPAPPNPPNPPTPPK